MPHLGLVCVTHGPRCRFRTITRTQFLKLVPAAQQDALHELYWSNLQRLNWTLSFCASRGIRLYRATSSLFPMSDEPLGREVLDSMGANLSAVGRRAQHLGIRVVMHPDQFVVLNSSSRAVARTSARILEKHAMWFDLLGLPRTPWSALIIHGGKSGRAQQLERAIAQLPEPVRSRLCLENDEYAFSAEQVLQICRRSGVPMIFDNLHHAIREQLQTYDDPSFERYTRLARETWPDPRWQIVHLSNGRGAFLDRNHADFITSMPDAFRRVQWIEVEAKAKELAIADLTLKMCC